MADDWKPVAVVRPVDVDDNGRWSLSQEQRQALGQDLGQLIDRWALEGPEQAPATPSPMTDDWGDPMATNLTDPGDDDEGGGW
ncbi:MAG: hypothetical protein AAF962_03145 [Actinomycetota bacterium]